MKRITIIMVKKKIKSIFRPYPDNFEAKARLYAADVAGQSEQQTVAQMKKLYRK